MTNDKATPRPWTFEKHIKHTKDQELKWFGNIVGHYGNNVIRTISCQCRYGTDEENQANAELIVRAVNNFDSLLFAAEEARSFLEGQAILTCEQEALLEVLSQAITKATEGR